MTNPTPVLALNPKGDMWDVHTITVSVSPKMAAEICAKNPDLSVEVYTTCVMNVGVFYESGAAIALLSRNGWVRDGDIWQKGEFRAKVSLGNLPRICPQPLVEDVLAKLK